MTMNIREGKNAGRYRLAVAMSGAVLALIMLIGVPYTAPAADVTLAWDANTEPDLAGYKIHYGTSTRNYQHSVSLTVAEAGSPPTFSLTGLQGGIVYYIAATAVDAAGNESGFSNEVEYRVPDALFSDDFGDGGRNGDPEWLNLSGGWVVNSIKQYVSASDLVDRTVVSDPAVGAVLTGRIDAVVKLTATTAAGSVPNAAIMFSHRGPGHYRYVRLRRDGLFIGQVGDYPGDSRGLKAVSRLRLYAGRWYHLTIDLYNSGEVKAYLNHLPQATVAKFAQPIAGQVGCQVSKARSLFDNFEVWDETALPM